MNPELLKLLPLLASLLLGVACACLTAWYLRDRKLTLPTQTQDPNIQGHRRLQRQKALETNTMLRLMFPVIRVLAAILAPLPVAGLRKSLGQISARAGYPGGLSADELLAISVMLGAAAAAFMGLCLGLLQGPANGLLGLALLPFGPLLTISSLRARGELRQQQILATLPYVMDLLVLTLRSGISLPSAMKRIVGDYPTHPIGHEFDHLLTDIELGVKQKVAFERFAQRLELPEVTSIVDAVLQSDELGQPLADTLERLSDRMTVQRLLRAQESAGAAGVTVMVPAMLVLAASIVLLFSPMIVRMMRGEMSLN